MIRARLRTRQETAAPGGRPRAPRRRRTGAWLLGGLLLGWCLPFPVAAAEEVPRTAPPPTLPLRPQLPGKAGFLTTPIVGGSLLPPGESRWRWGVSHTNVLTFSRGIIVSERPAPTLDDVIQYTQTVHETTGLTLFYFDGEATRFEVGWSRGMPGGWELGASLPLIRHGGGAMDHLINEFHDEFGLSDAGRDSAPDNAAASVLLNGEGSFILANGELARADLGDLTLSARFPLSPRGGRLTADAMVLVELPTGEVESLAGSGDTDLGVSASLSWNFLRSTVTCGIGYARLGDLDAAPGLPVEDTVNAGVAWQHRLSNRSWFLGQILHQTSPFRDVGADGISDTADLIAIGPRLAVGRGWFVDIAMLQDLFHHNADLDFGLQVNLWWSPGG